MLFLVSFTGDVELAADFITYRDREEFNQTAGPPVFLERFSNFKANIDFSFTTTDAPNGFSITHEGDDRFGNLIDGGAGILQGFIDGDFTEENQCPREVKLPFVIRRFAMPPASKKST